MDNENLKGHSFRHSTNQSRHSVMTHSATAASIQSASESQPSEATLKVPSKELEIEFGHGVSELDKSLSRRDKNAVDFVFNYSKLWCKTCKDVVLCLEKRAYAENEACRSIIKQFQILEASLINGPGAPMRQQLSSMARTLLEHCKEVETHNTKRCRELLEVLTRQRVLFEKTRKFLKDKWKADVKRLLDAENSLIKTKAAYYQRCQTGVKLREELSAAQTLLNELNASMLNAASMTSISSGSGVPGGFMTGATGSTAIQGTGTTLTASSTGLLSIPGADGAEMVTDQSTTAPGTTSTTNQIVKQKAKVERLEKQLSDNDRKEIEQMYAYREAVENANSRLYELEKSKMEIVCDIRLTITKSDEVVKDSMAELFNHIHSTRLAMINQYEGLAAGFQSFVPCSDYRSVVEDHIQKGVDCFPEKYQFAGFHEGSGLKMDSLSGRFLSRISGSTREATEGDPLSLHSDSESEGEQQLNENNAPHPGKPSGFGSGSSNVLSSIVEFGSSLFRPDAKRSIRGKRNQQSGGPASASSLATPGATITESVDMANLDKEYTAALYVIARCVAAIEKQPNGLETHGIYRVPASKAKVAGLLEVVQVDRAPTREQLSDEIALLSQEQPLTLAGLVKTRLIALPEPLLTYNLYPNFVELGKLIDGTETNIQTELVKRLQILIDHLSPANKKLAGLLFHHLNRVSACQSENQMSSVNLGTMFAPTVLRQKPKFQVANMMDLVDNKGQSRIVEVLIDSVTEIFGSPELYDPIQLLLDADACCDVPDVDLDRSGGRSSQHASPRLLARTLNVEHRKPASLHPVTPRTHSSQHSTASSTAGEESASTGSQHSLIRSATIASAPSCRPSVLLSNPLPLYTPYESARLPLSNRSQDPKDGSNPSDGEAESTCSSSNPASTAVHTTPVKLVQLAERADTSLPIQLRMITPTVNRDEKAAGSDRLLPGIPSTNVTKQGIDSSATPLSSQSSSTSGCKTVASGLKKEFMPIRKHPTVDKSATPIVSSTLSNLVIGRRRGGNKSSVFGQSSEGYQPNDSGDSKGSTEFDDYSYIDTDPSDSPTP